MKIVMNNDAVAHAWAHRTQPTARNSSNQFYFRDEAIYSFGGHFIIAAHLEDGRVLWNDASYSSTTSTQQSTVRRAMTTQQREDALHVPELNYDLWVDLYKSRKSGDGKALPKLVQLCADRIIAEISSMSSRRYGAGPMEHTFYTAKRLEQQGLALCEYVKKGRSKSKWPLPLLPATLPAKEDLPAFIKKYAAVQLKKQFDTSMWEAERRVNQLREDKREDNPHPYRVQNYLGLINAAHRHLDVAERDYKILHSKASSAVKKARKELEVLEAWAKPKVEEYKLKIAREDIGKFVREAYNKLRTRKVTGIKPYYGFDHVVRGLKELVRDMPEAETYGDLIARLVRIVGWAKQEDRLTSARAYRLATEGSEKASDRKRYFTQVASALQEPFTPKFLELRGEEIKTLQVRAAAGIEVAQATLLQENKEKLDNWLSGASDARPAYELGTYARIKGNVVETTRSANVPIEHAVRLARLYRITVRRGGADWRDGSGPMVGHYRVNKIGDDGSLVIGCHDFSKEEAERLACLLEKVDALFAAA